MTDDNGNGVDSDPDGDAITVTSVNGNAANVGSSVVGSNGGSFTINGDGSYTFVSGVDFNDLALGETRDSSVTYTITDDDGGTSTATATVRVSGENDDPTAVGGITDQTNDDGDAVSLDVSSFFADVDATDSLSYSHGGTLPPGLSINSSTGVISGTLDRSASTGGPYAVTITADDGNGGSTIQSFTWSVNNPAPNAQDDDLIVTENGTLAGNVRHGRQRERRRQRC